MQVDSLREKFLNFFESRKHKIVASDSLVPGDDPTVLFTPAGMNQFKKEFMGFDAGYRRAATSQRCLRTDDLDKVGKTCAHHTFFEMLGNFSFGDYFKKEAIAWAWEFLTKELAISEEKIWVSVYKDDDEAYNIWLKEVGIPAKKIVKLGDKDNFWPAEAKDKGPNGPCGPCSEIFFDFGKEVGCGKDDCSPACNCGRFVEVWNLVFTQFNRKDDASLVPLPNKNIDTGMGLERLTAVMEGKLNNFQTSLFEPIVKEIRSRISIKITSEDECVYAVADHIRAAVFCIYDGVIPSNEGRGYIVRKIIRKSVLHLRSLGVKEPFLNKLVSLVAKVMHNPYPDLADKTGSIAQLILNEEKNFIKTLNSSSVLFEEKFSPFIKNQDADNVGRIAFLLHDTYGIPLELTRRWLDEHKVKFSQASFDRELKEQKERSRTQSNMKGDVFDSKALGLKLKETKFIGYKEHVAEAKILAILKEKNEIGSAIAGNEELKIILDQTPFYAESGGQIGDTGELKNEKNIFKVLDTQKIDNLILHIGRIESGKFSKGDSVNAKIDIKRRLNIARNHTATHVLQAALRKVLGDHVQQQGSLVGEEKLRFDFTHFKKLSDEEIARIEEVANSYIVNDCAVESQEMGFQDAKKKGALAFFEEKYGEKVRVVTVGNFSQELCAGTHLDSVNEIGLIKIISEGSVASGVRRIEAATAAFAKRFIAEEEQAAIEESVKKNKLEELKKQEKKRSQALADRFDELLPQLVKKSIEIKGVNAIFSLEDDLDMNALRILADKLKEKISQSIIALGSFNQAQEKAFLVIVVTKDLLSKGFDAGLLIRKVAPLIGGSGGGRSDFAQAGGNNPGALGEAMEELKKAVRGI